MVKVKALQGYECNPKYVSEVVLPTMDTYLRGVDTQQYQQYSHNFIHVMHPHLQFSKKISKEMSYEEMLKIGVKNLDNLIENKVFIKSTFPCVYIYTQKTGNLEQTGILLSLHFEEYENQNIKKHEQVIESKVDTICKVVDSLSVYNSAPSTFCHFPQDLMNFLLIHKKLIPLFNFINNDTRHILYKVDQENSQKCIDMISKIEKMYIADGHHRFKTYSTLCRQFKNKNQCKNLLEDFEYFPVFVFPKQQLHIHKFNRYVFKDNNLNLDQIIQKIDNHFTIKPIVLDWNKVNNKKYEDYLKDILAPKKKGQITMFHSESKKWFSLTRKQYYKCPLKNLDLEYLSEKVLIEVFQIDLQCRAEIQYIESYEFQPSQIIQDFRKNNAKICFIGTEVDLSEIEAVANENKTMPPKTTLFYPKPMIGMVLKHFRDLE